MFAAIGNSIQTVIHRISFLAGPLSGIGLYPDTHTQFFTSSQTSFRLACSDGIRVIQTASKKGSQINMQTTVLIKDTERLRDPIHSTGEFKH